MAVIVQLQDGTAGLQILLDKPRINIGRGPENEINIDDELVSKSHAVIEAVPAKDEVGRIDFYIQDMQSTNNTYVNDKLVNLHRLRDQDIIRIGSSNFQFLEQEPQALEETSKLHKTWIPGVYYTKKKKD